MERRFSQPSERVIGDLEKLDAALTALESSVPATAAALHSTATATTLEIVAQKNKLALVHGQAELLQMGRIDVSEIPVKSAAAAQDDSLPDTDDLVLRAQRRRRLTPLPSIPGATLPAPSAKR